MFLVRTVRVIWTSSSSTMLSGRKESFSISELLEEDMFSIVRPKYSEYDNVALKER